MKLRKIFIAHSWTDVGVNIQTKAVAKKLSEANKVLFISQARIGSPEIKENQNLTVVEWPNKRPNTIKDFLFICKKILKERPEVFIAHFGSTHISMIAAWLLRVKHRVCWMHTLTRQYYVDTGNAELAAKMVNTRKRIYKLATHVIVLNDFGAKDAREGFRVPDSKIVKIYNGIFPIDRSGKEAKAEKSVRFIGRLDRSKGVDILLAAFEMLISRGVNIRLDLAGKGSDQQMIEDRIKTNKLEGKVTYHGYFTDYKNSRSFIAEAYCLIVSSRIDNFPTVILEALSAGVPVIASNVAGIPEMIEDDKDGFLVDAENVADLADAIERLTVDPSLRRRMSEAALLNFNKKFSMDQHVSNVEQFIHGLLN